MPATIVKMEMEDVDVYSDSPDEEADGGPASAGAASYNSGQATNTQCAVCEEVTENHHMHYGAFCCFSCRAFFRRANQRTNKSPYICKNESKCDVTFKNRKKCQKCRLNKCITAGMDPTLVLNDDQKKARFRKMIDKKSPSSTSSASGSTSTLTTSDHSRSLHGITRGQIRRPRASTASAALHLPALIPMDVPPVGHRGRSPSLRLSISSSTSVAPVSPASSTEVVTSFDLNNMFDDDDDDDDIDIIISHAVQAENNALKSCDSDEMSEFDKIMLETSNVGLQNDSIAELGATLCLANQFHKEKLIIGAGGSFRGSYSTPSTSAAASSSSLFRQTSLNPCDLIQPPIQLRISRIDPHPGPEPHLDPMTSLDSVDDDLNDDTSPAADARAASIDDEDSCSSTDESSIIIRGLLDSFKEACNKIMLSDGLVRRLVAFHSHSPDCSKKPRNDNKLTFLDFKTLVHTIVNQFWHFATEQTTFQRLPKVDQSSILNLNSGLYLNYVLGRYFTAANGFSQLKWLIGVQAANCLIRDDSSLHHITIEEFNCCVRLFEDESQANYYVKTALNLNSDQLGYEENGLVAATLLYNTRLFQLNKQGSALKTVDLADPELVKTSFNSLISCIRSTSTFNHLVEDGLETSLFVNSIIRMKDILKIDSINDEAGKCTGLPVKIDLEIPYSSEEAKWFDSRMVKYATAVGEVPMGPEWIKEFVMFTYDVPLSKHFASRGYSTFLERYRRVLRIHDGFADLSKKDQAEIWKSGSAKAVALCSAKIECLNTGMEQLEFIFGKNDTETWRQNFEEVIPKNRNKIKKVSMVDCNRVSSILDTKELMDYMNLVVALGELISDDEMFRLLTLVALFSGDDLPQEAEKFVTNIRNQYFAIYQRKFNKEDQVKSVDRLSVGLNDVNDLSKILKKLNIHPTMTGVEMI